VTQREHTMAIEFFSHLWSTKRATVTVDPCQEPSAGLNTDEDEGLSDAEASRRMEQYGPNELPDNDRSMLVKFLLEFVQPMPLVIWFAVLIESISLYLEWDDRGAATTGIVDVLCLLCLQILNVGVGFIEELKASREIATLKDDLKIISMVKRNGKMRRIPARELVPGDIVGLGPGVAVPADCRLVGKSKPCYVDCSAITGESLPVKKKGGEVLQLSTTVIRGEAEALVTATGACTESGQNQQLINSVDEIGHFDVVLNKMLVLLIVMGVIVNCIIVVYVRTHSLCDCCCCLPCRFGARCFFTSWVLTFVLIADDPYSSGSTPHFDI